MKGKDLLGIAKDFGAPVYVYDAGKIQSQFKRLTHAFRVVPKLKLNYAAKALSNLSILRLLNNLGSGLDTVSIQEVQLGLLAGYRPEDIIYTPNGVSLEEIEEAASLGVQINIDNLSILEQFGSKHPDIPVCIRINPHVMAGGNSKISVGHIDSKFGISIHQIPHLLRIVELTKMKINGGTTQLRIVVKILGFFGGAAANSTPFVSRRCGRSMSKIGVVARTGGAPSSGDNSSYRI